MQQSPYTRVLREILQQYELDACFKDNALKWFNTLAEDIFLHSQGASNPLVVGIQGCQGSGKSTLAAYLQCALEQIHGVKVARLSLDDFYYPRYIRQQLATQCHPLFATRGVPGTHDLPLLLSTLAALVSRSGRAVKLPRFNKAIDDPFPRSQWPITENTDIVIIEGWCWGLPPQSETALAVPINALEQTQDPDELWRRQVNTYLAADYQQAFAHTDMQILLAAPSFDCVTHWRLQQEQALSSQQGNAHASQVMNAQQIAKFVQHFQRLTEHALQVMPQHCHRVYQLDNTRNITSLTRNSLSQCQKLD